MPTWGWIPIGIAIVVIVAVLAVLAWRQRRSIALRRRFGGEYDRTIDDAGQRRAGEAALRHRERHRAQLTIQPLPPAARTRYMQQWYEIQERFVDQPELAVTEADTLLTMVMSQRGYPVDDFDAQADLISVDHPDLVENYRAAHEVNRNGRERQATTEQLRAALLRYRSLFEELLRPEVTETAGADARPGDAGTTSGASNGQGGHER